MPEFSGYKWDGPLVAATDERTQNFLNKINWDALRAYASKLHKADPCTLDPDFALGGRHMVRKIDFEDGSRWIARLRMTEYDPGYQRSLLQREVDCLLLVKERTTVPVPKILGYIADGDNEIGAPFILMECLAGNVAIEMNGHGSDIPPQHEKLFWRDVARIQAEISSITFPKIGSIIRLEDGTYDVGPLPHLGGPFNTATEYLEAWARLVKFPESDMADLRERCPEQCDELRTSIINFPPRLKELAATIPLRNNGPFPLCHPDFGHQNIIVDDDYQIISVIDWEEASTVPWETLQYPLYFGHIPIVLQPPWLFTKSGSIKYDHIKEQPAKREFYLSLLRAVEAEMNLTTSLSDVLGDEAGQDLATLIDCYTLDRVCGWYTRVLDAHVERFRGEVSQPRTSKTVASN